MKIALLCNNGIKFGRVFTERAIAALSEYGEVSARIDGKSLEQNAAFLADAEYVFSTWGMPALTEDQIARYLPSLKAVFYCAGTVRYFAEPFLARGIKVYSAAAVNAVPVAEFAFAQICLALKGYYTSAKCARFNPLRAYLHAEKSTGCFNAKVGLVGLGKIGRAVAEKLKALDVEVLAYDAFASDGEFAAVGARKVSLEELFAECDVVSNHLADVPATRKMLNGALFRSMKKRATFVNTARPAQVSDCGLASALFFHPARTAVIDVVNTETVMFFNPLFWCRNAFFTPHIAGSTGNEPERMALTMAEELGRIADGLPPRFEVKAEDLGTMA